MRKLLCGLIASALVAGNAFAATPKTYQVTGPVVEDSDSSIIVQKGKEKWEIKKGPDTKVTGAIKPGSKVTITYTMAAASIESKGGTSSKTKTTK
jgi:hypothetical protein